MFNIIVIFFSIQLAISLVLRVRKKKTSRYIALNQSANTSIIIPFKNEEKRLLPLIESINKTAIANKNNHLFSHFQFIFIDDHSTDKGCDVLLNELDVAFQIIRLKTTYGKKQAIKKGVEEATFERILTLDADVSFDTHYLENISKLPCKGLTILPVEMDSISLLKRLFTVEFWFLQHLTFGLTGILANGANLMFTKAMFDKTLGIRTDFNQPSGDDIFLLKACKKLNLPILGINNSELMVYTQPPQSFNELIQQRKRWISKMKDLPSFLGGFFIVFSNVFLVLSIYLSLTSNWIYIIPILIKICSEILTVDDLKKQFIILLHQFYYPFYLLALLITLPFSKKESKWIN